MAVDNYYVLKANNNVEIEDKIAVKCRFDTKLHKFYKSFEQRVQREKNMEFETYFTGYLLSKKFLVPSHNWQISLSSSVWFDSKTILKGCNVSEL